ncbi:glycoside hydrolase family 73 protein [Pedobacter sp. JCM 36344]|uniref:glycoside hydrolase family 73 protein n=1 Tax=Pedobacter sp. JCM 36344 TaxID=3374280 RepID=UPI003979BEE1
MTASRLAFIQKVSSSAVDATIGTGLFPSLLIAQACLEGRDGASLLAKKYNNHFGIKASAGWIGATILMNTKEFIRGAYITVKAPFRAYRNLTDGFKDRCNFLIKNSRYEKNGVFKAATAADQARALQKAGYATDPNYANSLISLIKLYGLEKFDVEKKK